MDHGNTGHGRVMLTPPRGPPPDFGSVSFDIDIETKDDGDDTPSDPLRVKGWHEFVHPTIRELTKNLRAKNKVLKLNKGLEMAGMNMDDLPDIKCKDSATPPREGLCYKFILGRCDAGEACDYCHVPAKDLSDDLIAKLAPPLTKVVKQGLEKLEGRRKRKSSTEPNNILFQE